MPINLKKIILVKIKVAFYKYDFLYTFDSIYFSMFKNSSKPANSHQTLSAYKK